ncbi:MAG: hypothetical protein AAB276_04810, partial [Pseudomonadota bacterium]
MTAYKGQANDLLKSFDKRYDADALAAYQRAIRGGNSAYISVLLEYTAAYHAWELLSDPEVFNVMRRLIHDNGYSPLNWISWPKSPRTPADARHTVNVVMTAGFSPFERNMEGEDAFMSLE